MCDGLGCMCFFVLFFFVVFCVFFWVGRQGAQLSGISIYICFYLSVCLSLSLFLPFSPTESF